MAFWGVQVKPGKPYTHIHDSNRGPLRLSQATLGNGVATNRSVLQCNVGNKSPVLLCSLLPDRAETSGLDLQFEESEEVVFSVVGPRSVHLAGYFIGGSGRRGVGDANDSDSYGEDICNTGSDESGSYGSEEDKYESDFIDDGDIEMSPSPPHSGGVIIEEIVEDKKPTNENHTRRRLRKKHQVSDSDEGGVSSQHQNVFNNSTVVSESEDEEDGFPISFSTGNKKKKKNDGGSEQADNKILNADKRRKPYVVVQDKDSECRENTVVAGSNGKSKKKKKDRIKSAKSLETDTRIPGENIGDKRSEDPNKCVHDKRDRAQACEGESEKVNQDHGHEEAVTESSRKLKKRKKEKIRRGESPETTVDLTVDKCEERASTEKHDTANNIEHANPGHHSVADEKEIFGSSGKLKRKKKKTKGKNSVDEENRSSETPQEDGNEKSYNLEVIKNEASMPWEPKEEDQSVDGMPSEMTANIDGGPVLADIRREPSKKKQKKKNR